MKTVPSKGAKRTPRAETVDGYLATLPEDARAALEKLRKTIKAAAPKATEVISYQIPTFKHQGMLVAFAAFEGHCGFYIMSPERAAESRRRAQGIRAQQSLNPLSSQQAASCRARDEASQSPRGRERSQAAR